MIEPADPPAHGAPPAPDRRSHRLALVLTGGGARAAYQVGLLRWLGRRTPELRFDIITGVSAGAINACYLAGHAAVVLLVFAILLPTVDPVSLAFEVVPLVILFEMSIWLSVLMERRWDRGWDEEFAETGVL